MSAIKKDKQGVARRPGHRPPAGLLGSPVTPRRPAHSAESVPPPANAVWIAVAPDSLKADARKILDVRDDLMLSLLEQLRSSPLPSDIDDLLQNIISSHRQRTDEPRPAENEAPEPTADDLDAALDRLDPNTTPSRDAGHFRRIIEARKQLADAEAALRSAVKAARQAGDSWTVIGAALDTSRQAAFQRFGKD